MRCLTLLFTALVLLMCPGLSMSQSTSLIPFELQDQFGEWHTDDPYRGVATILVTSDRKGSRHNKEWVDSLMDAVSLIDPDRRVRFLAVGHVEGVPFFLKAWVRGKFPKNRDEPVLMDWEGVFHDSYDVVEDATNLFLFGADGQQRSHVAGDELNRDALDRFVSDVRDYLSEEADPNRSRAAPER